MKKGLIALLLLPAILVVGCSSTGTSQHANSSSTGTIHVPGYSIDQNESQSNNS